MEMDRDNYRGDYRKGSRIIINSWIKNGDLNDVFRDYHPEKRAFTWYRRENKLIVQKGRMDLTLISPALMGLVTDTELIYTPVSISDHWGTKTTFRIEATKEGPGTFRAIPRVEFDPGYRTSIKYLITQEIVELSNLSHTEKLEESRINTKIFSLTTEMNKNNIDEESTL